MSEREGYVGSTGLGLSCGSFRGTGPLRVATSCTGPSPLARSSVDRNTDTCVIDQVRLSRQNVVTIIKGTREPEFSERERATAMTRQERKHGDWTMTFRIPEEYNRRWDSVTVENGVLEIRYLKDHDEEEA